MPVVRILVDGYNLLAHILERDNLRVYRQLEALAHWPVGASLHSEDSRNRLIDLLLQYRDIDGTAITVFFDGRGKKTKPKNVSHNEVEVIFSGDGQTADDLLERTAHRFQPYGEVLVVTDDLAVRDTVGGFGGLGVSCEQFMRMIQIALAELHESLNNHNRAEQNRFRRR